jgi:hypothetical protein
VEPENRAAYGKGKVDALPDGARLGCPQLHAVMLKVNAVRQVAGDHRAERKQRQFARRRQIVKVNSANVNAFISTYLVRMGGGD